MMLTCSQNTFIKVYRSFRKILREKQFVYVDVSYSYQWKTLTYLEKNKSTLMMLWTIWTEHPAISKLKADLLFWGWWAEFKIRGSYAAITFKQRARFQNEVLWWNRLRRNLQRYFRLQARLKSTPCHEKKLKEHFKSNDKLANREPTSENYPSIFCLLPKSFLGSDIILNNWDRIFKKYMWRINKSADQGKLTVPQDYFNSLERNAVEVKLEENLFQKFEKDIPFLGCLMAFKKNWKTESCCVT